MEQHHKAIKPYSQRGFDDMLKDFKYIEVSIRAFNQNCSSLVIISSNENPSPMYSPELEDKIEVLQQQLNVIRTMTDHFQRKWKKIVSKQPKSLPEWNTVINGFVTDSYQMISSNPLLPILCNASEFLDGCNDFNKDKATTAKQRSNFSFADLLNSAFGRFVKFLEV